MVMQTEWIPKEHHVEWLKSLFNTLKEGGFWITPATNHIFQKIGDKLVWKNHKDMEDTNGIYSCSVIIGNLCNIEVIKENDHEN